MDSSSSSSSSSSSAAIKNSAATTEITGVDGEKQKLKLVDVQVTSPHEALQMLVTFLNLAQKRGSFTMDESAKIWECIKMFQHPSQEQDAHEV